MVWEREIKEDIVFFNESEKRYIEATPQTMAFWKHMTVIHTRILICVTIKKFSLTDSYKTIITHIRVDHIYIFCKQSHSHSFKCYNHLKIEKI